MGNINGSQIGIPTLLKIESGALLKIGDFLADSGLMKVVIYFGNGLTEMFGNKVMESLDAAGVEVLEHKELDTVEINDIMNLAFSLPNQTQAIIGLGGGKVIDAAKYACYLKKLPFTLLQF